MLFLKIMILYLLFEINKFAEDQECLTYDGSSCETNCYPNSIITGSRCECSPGFFKNPDFNELCTACQKYCQDCVGYDLELCYICLEHFISINQICSPVIDQFSEIYIYFNKSLISETESPNTYIPPIFTGIAQTNLLCVNENLIYAQGKADLNIFHFEKEISEIHYSKIISFVFYSFSNNVKSSLTLKFYHENITQRIIWIVSEYENKNYCATSFKEAKRNIVHVFQNSDLYLNFTLTFNDPDGEWGIREFNLEILLCDKFCKTCTGPKINQCSTCFFNLIIIEGKCGCNEGFWLKEIDSNNFLCFPCHITCKYCKGPEKTDCTQCKNHFYLINEQCISNQNFVQLVDDFNNHQNCPFPMFLAYNFLYCDIYFDCFGFHYFSPTTLDQGNKKNLHTITKQYDFEESQIFPPHYELFYSFYLLIIQSNENNSSENYLEQKIEISLDDQVILNEALLIKNSYYNCSNSKIFLFIGSVPHSAKNPKFSLKISNIFKWGIRNLELSVNKCEDNCIECTSNKICTNPCSYSNYKSNELICPKYYQCYETCDNCMGPSMNDCLVCKDSENYLLQNTTCVDLNKRKVLINEIEFNTFGWNVNQEFQFSICSISKPFVFFKVIPNIDTQKIYKNKRVFDLSQFPHYSLYFNLTYIAVYYTQYFNLSVLVDGISYPYNFKKAICPGETFNQTIFTISQNLTHNSSSLTIEYSFLGAGIQRDIDGFDFGFQISSFFISFTKCHFRCKDCDISNPRKCTECYDDMSLYYNDNLYMQRYDCGACKQGYFKTSEIYINKKYYPMTCEPCHDTCRYCYNNTEYGCYICYENMELRAIENFRRVCVCISGYFLDIISKVCKMCHITCETCDGYFINNCLSCNNSFVLNNSGFCVHLNFFQISTDFYELQNYFYPNQYLIPQKYEFLKIEDCNKNVFYSPKSIDKLEKIFTIEKYFGIDGFEELPPHYELFYSFYILIFDEEENMNFDLEIFIVDHYLVKNFKNITKNNTISCSNVYFFNGKFKIAEKYLKFAIRLSKIKNWAIKKLEFFVLGCSTGCLSCNGPSQEQCLDFNCKPYNWKEITPKGSYCRSCYSLCYSCFGSQSNNCLECRSDFSLIDNTCVKTTADQLFTIINTTKIDSVNTLDWKFQEGLKNNYCNNEYGNYFIYNFDKLKAISITLSYDTPDIPSSFLYIKMNMIVLSYYKLIKDIFNIEMILIELGESLFFDINIFNLCTENSFPGYKSLLVIEDYFQISCRKLELIISVNGFFELEKYNFYFNITSLYIGKLLICHYSCKKCESKIGVTEQMCKECYDGMELDDNHECKCPMGKFYLENESEIISSENCKNCDSSCLNCYGIYINNCILCKENFILVNGICSKNIIENFTDIQIYEDFQDFSKIDWKIDDRNFNELDIIKINNSDIISYGNFTQNERLSRKFEKISNNFAVDIRLNLIIISYLDRSYSSFLFKIQNNFLDSTYKINSDGFKKENFTYISKNSSRVLEESDITNISLLMFTQDIEFTIKGEDNLIFLELYRDNYYSNDFFNESWAILNFSISFYLCHSSCSKCYGPLNDKCFSCINSSFVFFNNSCLINCPSGFFKFYDQYLDISFCKKCHDSCLNCLESSEKDCLSCKEGTFLYDGRCSKCYKNCLTCFGNSENECDSCIENYYLKLFTCESSCGNNYYVDKSIKKCLKCQLDCKKCDGLNCVECYGSKVLFEDQCYDFCPTSYYNQKGICLKCNENCKNCILSSKCTECNSNMFLSKDSCQKSKLNNVTLIERDSPLVFKLIFSYNWPDYFKNIKNYINISLNGYLPKHYSYKIEEDSQEYKSFLIYMNFNTNITNNTNLKIILSNSSQLTNSIYFINNTELNVNLHTIIYCIDNSYLQEDLFCTPREANAKNTEIIFYEIDSPSKYLLKIINGDYSLQNQLIKRMILKIPEYSKDNFTYNITPIEIDKIGINLIYYSNITNNKKLNINYNLPNLFLNNYEKEIIMNQSETILKDYYILSEDDKSLFENVKAIKEIGSQTQTASLIASVMLLPSFGPIKIIMLSSMITNLRYLDIDYPEIMKLLFNLKLDGFPLLLINYKNPDNFFLDEKDLFENPSDIRLQNDIFTKYGIYIYFIYNFGDNLIQIIIVYIISNFIIFLKTKIIRDWILKIIVIIEGFLVWGWLLSFFFSNFKNIIFFIIRSWFSNNFNTLISKIDIIISSICLFLGIIVIIHISLVNKKIYKHFNKSNKRITKIPVKFSASEQNIDIQSQHIDSKIEIPEIKDDLKKFNIDIQNKFQNIIVSELTNKTNLSSEVNRRDFNIKIENVQIIAENLMKKAKKLDCTSKKSGKKSFFERSLVFLSENFIKKYEIIVEEVKRDSLWSVNYALIEMLKFCLYSIIIVVLYQRPFLQCVLMLHLNIYFVFYLIIIRPFKSNVILAYNILNEIIMIFAFVDVMILSYCDMFDVNNISLKLMIARNFCYLNTILIATYFLFLFFKIITTISKNWKTLKLILDKRKQKR